jgi:hypothetical protein
LEERLTLLRQDKQYFDKLVKVDLTVKSVNDHTLTQVAALSDFKEIRLGNAQIPVDLAGRG